MADSAKFLTIKLDFIKPLITTLVVFDGGIVSYLFVNFENLSLIKGLLVFIAFIGLSAYLAFLFFYCFKLMDQIKRKGI